MFQISTSSSYIRKIKEHELLISHTLCLALCTEVITQVQSQLLHTSLKLYASMLQECVNLTNPHNQND